VIPDRAAAIETLAARSPQSTDRNYHVHASAEQPESDTCRKPSYVWDNENRLLILQDESQCGTVD
jgi:hypothetical protein